MKTEFCMFAFKFLFAFSCIGCACGQKSAIPMMIVSAVMGVILDAMGNNNERDNGKA